MTVLQQIKFYLPAWVRTNFYDVIIQNYFHGRHEMDLFKLTKNLYVHEYEIKVSRSDFKRDFEKGAWRYRDNCRDKKHENLAVGSGHFCPNRFFFVVPAGLVSIEEAPKHAGLIFFTARQTFELKKPAPLLHKRPASSGIYKELCLNLNARVSTLEAHRRISQGIIDRQSKELIALKSQKFVT